MSQTNASTDIQQKYKETLAKNGFVLFKGFFDVNSVANAHSELQQLFATDQKVRTENKVVTSAFDGPLGRSYLFKAYHLLTEIYGKSKSLDGLFDKILTDPISKSVLEFLAGPNIKMRGYNVRLMSGEFDPPPALEFHRDNDGEIGIGILLTDIEPGHNASTSFVPGSHLYPINAQKDCLFLMPYEGNSLFLKFNIFSKYLEKTVLSKAESAWGKRGDFYIFINDSWHGRFPNMHGAKSMVFLAGAFPSEFPFPAHGTMAQLPDSVLKTLPVSIQKVLDPNPPLNQGRAAYLYKMFADREKLKFFSVWNFAKLERRLADLLSTKYLSQAFHFGYRQYLKWIRPILLPIARPIKRFIVRSIS